MALMICYESDQAFFRSFGIGESESVFDKNSDDTNNTFTVVSYIQKFIYGTAPSLMIVRHIFIVATYWYT